MVLYVSSYKALHKVFRESFEIMVKLWPIVKTYCPSWIKHLSDNQFQVSRFIFSIFIIFSSSMAESIIYLIAHTDHKRPWLLFVLVVISNIWRSRLTDCEEPWLLFGRHMFEMCFLVASYSSSTLQRLLFLSS